MAQIDLSSTVQRLLLPTLTVTAAVAVAVVLSLLAPRISTILLELRDALLRGRAVLLARSGEYFDARWAGFWAARANEPRAPVVAELQRVSQAVEQLGTVQVATLVTLERRLDTNMRVLRNLNAPAETKEMPERDRLVRAVSGGSLAPILFGVLIAVLVGAINSFLLGVFFREVLPSYRLLPYPLPDVQLGHVLAVLFFIIEIAMGWAIHRNGRRSVRTDDDAKEGAATTAVLAAIPWFMLVALGIVELFAYAVLSTRVDMPRRLALDPDSAVFGIAKYFLAFFGVCITALLAYLGHAIAESIDRYRRAHVERAIVRALQQSKKTALASAQRIRDTVSAITQTASAMPASLVAQFRLAIGAPLAEQDVLTVVHDSIARSIAAADPERAAALVPAGGVVPPRLPVRTPAQVTADLVVHALLLATLGALCVLTVYELTRFGMLLTPPVQGAIAWTAATALTSTIVMLGLMARSALRSLRYASPSTNAIPAPRGRVLLGSVLIGVLVIVALLMAGVALAAGPLSPFLSAPLAVVQVVAIAALATTLDACLVATGYLAYLAWLCALLLGAVFVSVFALLGAGACHLLTVLLRLLAVPGDVIRGWRAPVPVA
jgi:hypothetical protein